MAAEGTLSVWQQALVDGLRAAVTCVRDATPAVLDGDVQWDDLVKALRACADLSEADLADATVQGLGLSPQQALRQYCGVCCAPFVMQPLRTAAERAYAAEPMVCSGSPPRLSNVLAPVAFEARLWEFLRDHGPCTCDDILVWVRQCGAEPPTGSGGLVDRLQNVLLQRPRLFEVRGLPHGRWMAQEARWSAVTPSEVPRGLGEPQTILQSFRRAQGPYAVPQVQHPVAPAPGCPGVPVQKGLLPVPDRNGPVVTAFTASVTAPVTDHAGVPWATPPPPTGLPRGVLGAAALNALATGLRPRDTPTHKLSDSSTTGGGAGQTDRGQRSHFSSEGSAGTESARCANSTEQSHSAILPSFVEAQGPHTLQQVQPGVPVQKGLLGDSPVASGITASVTARVTAPATAPVTAPVMAPESAPVSDESRAACQKQNMHRLRVAVERAHATEPSVFNGPVTAADIERQLEAKGHFAPGELADLAETLGCSLHDALCVLCGDLLVLVEPVAFEARLWEFLRDHGPCTCDDILVWVRQCGAEPPTGSGGLVDRLQNVLLQRPRLFEVRELPCGRWMAQEARWSAVMPSEVPRGLGELHTSMASIAAPVTDPVTFPITATVTASVAAPVIAAVTAPATAAVTAPVTALATSPATAPVAAPVTAPESAPVSAESRAACQKQNMHRLRVAVERAHAAEPSVFNGPVTAADVERQLEAKGHFAPGELADLAETLGCSLHDALCVLCGDLLVLVEPVAFEARLWEYLRDHGPCTCADILVWVRQCGAEPPTGSGGLVDRLQNVLLQRPRLFEVRGLPCGRWMAQEARWSAVMPSEVPRGLGELHTSMASIAAPGTDPVTSPITATVTASGAAPVTAAVTAPVTALATAPVTAPATSPATAPVTAPVTAPESAPVSAESRAACQKQNMHRLRVAVERAHAAEPSVFNGPVTAADVERQLEAKGHFAPGELADLAETLGCSLHDALCVLCGDLLVLVEPVAFEARLWEFLRDHGPCTCDDILVWVRQCGAEPPTGSGGLVDRLQNVLLQRPRLFEVRELPCGRWMAQEARWSAVMPSEVPRGLGELHTSMASIAAPVTDPVTSPITATVTASVAAPMTAAVTAPATAAATAPVTALATSPATAPVAAPVTAPEGAPVSDESRAACQKQNMHRLRVAVERAHAAEPSVFNGPVTAADVERQLEAKGHFAPGELADLAETLGCSLHDALCVLCGDLLVLVEPVAFEARLWEYLRDHGPCTCADILVWVRQCGAEPPTGSGGLVDRLQNVLLQRPRLFEVRGLPCGRWMAQEARWSAVMPSEVPRGLGELHTSMASIAAPGTDPVTSPITATVTASGAAPVTAAVTAPVTALATAPVTAPATSPATAPVTAPVTAPESAPVSAESRAACQKQNMHRLRVAVERAHAAEPSVFNGPVTAADVERQLEAKGHFAPGELADLAETLGCSLHDALCVLCGDLLVLVEPVAFEARLWEFLRDHGPCTCDDILVWVRQCGAEPPTGSGGLVDRLQNVLLQRPRLFEVRELPCGRWMAQEARWSAVMPSEVPRGLGELHTSMASIAAPVTDPVTSPITATVTASVAAPMTAAVTAPATAAATAPVTALATSPATAPVAAPVTAPEGAPVSDESRAACQKQNMHRLRVAVERAHAAEPSVFNGPVTAADVERQLEAKGHFAPGELADLAETLGCSLHDALCVLCGDLLVLVEPVAFEARLWEFLRDHGPCTCDDILVWVRQCGAEPPTGSGGLVDRLQNVLLQRPRLFEVRELPCGRWMAQEARWSAVMPSEVPRGLGELHTSMASIAAPVTDPVTSPITATVTASVAAPMTAAVTAPATAAATAPVTALATSPATAPVAAPVTAPEGAPVSDESRAACQKQNMHRLRVAVERAHATEPSVFNGPVTAGDVERQLEAKGHFAPGELADLAETLGCSLHDALCVLCGDLLVLVEPVAFEARLWEFLRDHGPCTCADILVWVRQCGAEPPTGSGGLVDRLQNVLLQRPRLFEVRGLPHGRWMAQEARWSAVTPSEVPRGLGEPQTILQSFRRAQGPYAVPQVQHPVAAAPGCPGVPVQKGLLPVPDRNGPVVTAFTASVTAPVTDHAGVPWATPPPPTGLPRGVLGAAALNALATGLRPRDTPTHKLSDSSTTGGGAGQTDRGQRSHFSSEGSAGTESARCANSTEQSHSAILPSFVEAQGPHALQQVQPGVPVQKGLLGDSPVASGITASVTARVTGPATAPVTAPVTAPESAPVSDESRAACQKQNMHRLRVAVERAHATEPSVFNGPVTAADVERQLEAKGHFAPGELADLAETLGCSLHDALCVLCGDLLVLVEPVAFEARLWEYLRDHGPCTCADILVWVRQCGAEPPTGSGGLVDRLQNVLLQRPRLFEVRGLPCGRWMAQEARWSAVMPSEVPRGLGELHTSMASIAAPGTDPVTSPITATVTASGAAPVTAAVTAPVTALATSPVTAPATSPATAPVTAPVTAPESAPVSAESRAACQKQNMHRLRVAVERAHAAEPSVFNGPVTAGDVERQLEAKGHFAPGELADLAETLGCSLHDTLCVLCGDLLVLVEPVAFEARLWEFLRDHGPCTCDDILVWVRQCGAEPPTGSGGLVDRLQNVLLQRPRLFEVRGLPCGRWMAQEARWSAVMPSEVPRGLGELHTSMASIAAPGNDPVTSPITATVTASGAAPMTAAVTAPATAAATAPVTALATSPATAPVAAPVTAPEGAPVSDESRAACQKQNMHRLRVAVERAHATEPSVFNGPVTAGDVERQLEAKGHFAPGELADLAETLGCSLHDALCVLCGDLLVLVEPVAFEARLWEYLRDHGPCTCADILVWVRQCGAEPPTGSGGLVDRLQNVLLQRPRLFEVRELPCGRWMAQEARWSAVMPSEVPRGLGELHTSMASIAAPGTDPVTSPITATVTASGAAPVTAAGTAPATAAVTAPAPVTAPATSPATAPVTAPVTAPESAPVSAESRAACQKQNMHRLRVAVEHAHAAV